MKATHKKLIGAGGIKCPCCRPASLKNARVRLNRITRRKAKQEKLEE